MLKRPLREGFSQRPFQYMDIYNEPVIRHFHWALTNIVAYGYDLHSIQLPESVHFSTHTAFSKYSLLLYASLCRTPVFGILAQILCDIYSSIGCALSSFRSPLGPPFDFLFDTCSCQTARCFNKSKGVLITGSKLKAFRNPQPSWGFSMHKKTAPCCRSRYSAAV